MTMYDDPELVEAYERDGQALAEHEARRGPIVSATLQPLAFASVAGHHSTNHEGEHQP